MWPYSETEARWLSGENTRPEDITPEMIDAYLRDARRMRAELTMRFLLALPGALADALKSLRQRLTAVAHGHSQTM